MQLLRCNKRHIYGHMNEYKMKSAFSILLSVLLLSGIWACKDDSDEPQDCTPTADEGTVQMVFTPMANGSEINLFEEYTDPTGRTLRAELLKFYVSNVRLTTENGTSNLLKDVELLDFQGGGTNTISGTIPTGSYSDISFGLGLDEDKNATEPSIYPSDHPMSVSQNTHWGTWSKYKFLMIEGKADLNNMGSLNDIFNYHTGFDTCYRVNQYNTTIMVNKGQTTTLNFTFDLNAIFFGVDTLDMAVENSWHGSDPDDVDAAVILSNNLSAAMTLE